MPVTMKAAFVTELGRPPTTDELPAPSIKDDSIVVKLEAYGVCHTATSSWS